MSPGLWTDALGEVVLEDLRSAEEGPLGGPQPPPTVGLKRRRELHDCLLRDIDGEPGRDWISTGLVRDWTSIG